MSASERRMRGEQIAIGMNGLSARAIRAALIYALVSESRSQECFPRTSDRFAADNALRKITEALGHNLIPEVIMLDDETAA